MSSRDVIAVCQRRIGLHPNDCAAFVRGVASDCGVILAGDANRIVSLLVTGKRLANGLAARQAAADGALVVAGARATGHGHVVVVVDGPVARGRYPYAFWGQYHGLTVGTITANVGFTRGHGALNYAFGAAQRDAVTYAAFEPIATLLRPAAPGEGYLLHTFT